MSLALTLTRRILMVVLLVLIVLGPGKEELPGDARLPDFDVLIVVDRTHSMAATDYADSSRIFGLRSELRELVSSLPGARFSVITFGKEAIQEVPFTADQSLVLDRARTQSIEDAFSGGGSLIDRPLAEMQRALVGARSRNPDRQRIVFFLTDGENTAPGKQKSFSGLAKYVSGGAVFGFGRAAGATMPLAINDPSKGLVIDPSTGSPAVSRSDLDNLRTVAGQLGVDFYQRVGNPDAEPMAAIAGDLLAEFTTPGKRPPERRQLAWLYGLLLFGLSLPELRSGWRGWLAARREAR